MVCLWFQTVNHFGVVSLSGRQHGVPTELVYASMGPHGHPMSPLWTRPCEAWLRANGWAPKNDGLLARGEKMVETGGCCWNVWTEVFVKNQGFNLNDIDIMLYHVNLILILIVTCTVQIMCVCFEHFFDIQHANSCKHGLVVNFIPKITAHAE